MHVVEKFLSINGEGDRAGELSCFIRLKGCNLSCSYCDTRWANEPEAAYTQESPADLAKFVETSGADRVTLTGGEPLLWPDVKILVKILCTEYNKKVEIETNGSIDISPYVEIEGCSVTMDYKMAGSGCEDMMNPDNLGLLGSEDSVKFVVGDIKEVERAVQIARRYGILGRTNVFISPVFGKLRPKEIADYIIEEKINGVRLQLQLHKLINVR